MTDPFIQYAKKALSSAPAKLIGITKTRAEARAVYTALVGELHAARSLRELEAVLQTRKLEILQIQAEMEFLWFGDGHDFLGLEREIEIAFETVEAATYFRNSRPVIDGRVCEAGRLPGHLKQRAEADEKKETESKIRSDSGNPRRGLSLSTAAIPPG